MRIALLIAAVAAAGWAVTGTSADAPAKQRVFELRTYHAAPGKMAALHQRFRDHTLTLFKKHGIEVVGFWKPRDAAKAEEVFYYIVAYPSKEAADKAWAAFRADPAWVKAKADSEKDGSLTTKVESVYLDPTDYSPMK